MPNIAIAWDFDGTLSPDDSTSHVVEDLDGKDANEFWKYIKSLRNEEEKPEWEHVLATDAPTWTYSLSRIASLNKVPLNEEFFQKYVGNIRKSLYPNVAKFLKGLKDLEKRPEFERSETKIHHFIVSAGLCDLIRQVFRKGLITHVWGCRYEVITDLYDEDALPESVPVYCMDETAKTRALFEISKGTFLHPTAHAVNKRVADSDLFCRFEEIIYVGDGFTDVPALSLVRGRGGMGIIVFDPGLSKKIRKEKVDPLREDKRADLITKANFSKSGELYKSIRARCVYIQQRHAASVVY